MNSWCTKLHSKKDIMVSTEHQHQHWQTSGASLAPHVLDMQWQNGLEQDWLKVA